MTAFLSGLISSAPAIALVTLGLWFCAGDAHRIWTTHALLKSGDVYAYWPPLWVSWLRLVAVGLATAAVLAIEIYLWFTSPD